MTREIKFRTYEAYDENPRLVYSDEYQTLFEYVQVHALDEGHQQYTGLKDKNGKDIYEGDIVRHLQDGSISVVIWLKNNCCFVLNDVFEDDGSFLKTLISDDQEFYKLLGNIYENPEVLTNEKTLSSN